MSYDNLEVLVTGSLNTDLIGYGVNNIVGQGEQTSGGSFSIKAGGKSRNIAQMISNLSNRKELVSFLGITSKDDYGLWKKPINELENSGVITDFIKVYDFRDRNVKGFDSNPAIALIPVDKQGNNQIYVLEGISNQFSSEHVEEANLLFDYLCYNQGVLASTLEMPLQTLEHVVDKSNSNGLNKVLDLGGVNPEQDYSNLLSKGWDWIKPNEYEFEILTGVKPTSLTVSREASQDLLDMGVENILLSLGSEGAYFINNDSAVHIPTPRVEDTGFKDETGCGDQVTATLTYSMLNNYSLIDSAELGVLGGTLQFGKKGVQPVTKSELEKY